VFGVHGGTIGRGADNEWSLPDPERYLSVKHARVDFRAGSYILIDTSSNGTYVNGAAIPLEKHRDYPLRDGDFVRLGEYQLLVSIQEPYDIAQPATGPAGIPSPMTRPLEAPASFEGGVDAGLAAFCHGAGIDPRTLTPEAGGAALELAGRLLRESVIGLTHLNQHRDELHARFRIPPPPLDDPAESPLDLAHGVDEALARLLTSESSRTGAVDALKDNFRRLDAQNVAAMAALATALEELLERLAPKELEERFERGAKRGVFIHNKAKYWELYAGIYSGLFQRPANGFPPVFTEAVAKAYEAKLRTLIPPRRSACGAERNEFAEPSDSVAQDDRTGGDS
jgi:predicted component of type VI protein secretion system